MMKDLAERRGARLVNPGARCAHTLLSVLTLAMLLSPPLANAQSGVLCHGRHILGVLPAEQDDRAVAVVGSIVYVADGTYDANDSHPALKIIDNSDPANPVLLGSIDSNPTRQYTDIAVANGVAFLSAVSDFGGELDVIDVSNPAAPVRLDSLWAGDYYARGVEVVGTTVFVATGPDGMRMWDASNPASMQWIRAYYTPNNTMCLDVVGDTAYLLDSSSGLSVVDVSDPSTPHLLGQVAIAGSPRAIRVRGTTAFAAMHGAGMFAIDVSDPSIPTVLSTYPASISASGIALGAGDMVYVTDGYDLVALDASDPSQPQFVGVLTTPRGAAEVKVSGTLGVVAGFEGGLINLDLSDLPQTPVDAAEFDTPGRSLQFAINGTVAYVADDDAGLQILDISDPMNPTLLGGYDTTGLSRGLDAVGSTVYLCDFTSMRIFDASDPTNPIQLGYAIASSNKVKVAGSIAYVVGWALTTVDVSNPSAPVVLGSVALPDEAYDIAVAGSMVYVADDDEGLQIVDASDPSAPTIVGAYPTGPERWGMGVDLAGSYAFLAANTDGVLVLDVSDPADPVLVTSIELTELTRARDVVVQGQTAYVGFGDGLWIYDIADPASPRRLGAHPNGASAQIAITDGWALLTGGSSPARVIDLRDCNACPQDLNNDGQVNTLDFLAYLNIWSAGDPLADWNGDGQINTLDFLAYLNAWATGC